MPRPPCECRERKPRTQAGVRPARSRAEADSNNKPAPCTRTRAAAAPWPRARRHCCRPARRAPPRTQGWQTPPSSRCWEALASPSWSGPARGPPPPLALKPKSDASKAMCVGSLRPPGPEGGLHARRQARGGRGVVEGAFWPRVSGAARRTCWLLLLLRRRAELGDCDRRERQRNQGHLARDSRLFCSLATVPGERGALGALQHEPASSRPHAAPIACKQGPTLTRPAALNWHVPIQIHFR